MYSPNKATRTWLYTRRVQSARREKAKRGLRNSSRLVGMRNRARRNAQSRNQSKKIFWKLSMEQGRNEETPRENAMEYDEYVVRRTYPGAYECPCGVTHEEDIFEAAYELASEGFSVYTNPIERSIEWYENDIEWEFLSKVLTMEQESDVYYLEQFLMECVRGSNWFSSANFGEIIHRRMVSDDIDVIRLILSCVPGLHAWRLQASSRSERHWPSILHFAAAVGRVEIVKMLIEEFGMDPNSIGEESIEDEMTLHQTALHYAAKNGHVEVIKYLRHHAHVDEFVVNVFHRTALQIARQEMRKNAYELLLCMPWNVVRQIWIGYHQNDCTCPLARLPHAVVGQIETFLRSSSCPPHLPRTPPLCEWAVTLVCDSIISRARADANLSVSDCVGLIEFVEKAHVNGVEILEGRVVERFSDAWAEFDLSACAQRQFERLISVKEMRYWESRCRRLESNV